MFYVEKNGFISNCKYNEKTEQLEGYCKEFDKKQLIVADSIDNFKHEFEKMLNGAKSDNKDKKLLPDDIVFDLDELQDLKIIALDKENKLFIARCPERAPYYDYYEYKKISPDHFNKRCTNHIDDIKPAIKQEEKKVEKLETRVKQFRKLNSVVPKKLKFLVPGKKFDSYDDIERYCSDRMWELIHFKNHHLKTYMKDLEIKQEIDKEKAAERKYKEDRERLKTYFVKCENYEELTALYYFGRIGFGFESDWSKKESVEYPAYVNVYVNTPMGTVLTAISNDIPNSLPENVTLQSFTEFVTNLKED